MVIFFVACTNQKNKSKFKYESNCPKLATPLTQVLDQFIFALKPYTSGNKKPLIYIEKIGDCVGAKSNIFHISSIVHPTQLKAETLSEFFRYRGYFVTVESGLIYHSNCQDSLKAELFEKSNLSSYPTADTHYPSWIVELNDKMILRINRQSNFDLRLSPNTYKIDGNNYKVNMWREVLDKSGKVIDTLPSLK